MRFAFRENVLLWLSAIVYVAAMAAIALVMDAQFYQTAKTGLMRSEDFPDYPPQLPPGFDDDARSLVHDAEAREFLDSPDPDEIIRRKVLAQRLTAEERRQLESQLAATIQSAKIRWERTRLDERTRLERRKTLEEKIRAIQADYPSIVSVQLYLGKTELARLDRKNPHGLNSFRNSLILRNFTLHARFPLYSVNFLDERIGSLVFVYASPIGYEPVENLTRSYWLYLAASLLVVTLAYALTLRFILLPIKNVTKSIQDAEGRQPRFLRAPHSRLERLYNTMARDAMLAGLTGGLGRTRRLRISLPELFELLAPRIVDWFGFNGAWILELVWEGKELLALEGQMPEDKPGEPPAWEILRPAFDPDTARNLRASRESETPQLIARDLPSGKDRVFVGALPGSDAADRALRVLVLLKKNAEEEMPWFEPTADRLYRQVAEIVERHILQSRELFREKSETHVSLSRNLGHDLTNIIATNKLELMTIGQVLRADARAAAGSDDEARRIVREAIERLLDNTRSLQEIVNLYRTYEYLKSPRYEAVNLNLLISEIIEVFLRSMSSPAPVSFDSRDAMPPVEVEPRLLKLALFNLLLNAQDAVRQLPEDKQGDAGIFVQTSLDRDKKKVTVRVSDNGLGIRTADGRLAGKEEIRRIFELGYTTKAGGQAEGLGLNWVRTILTEFHAGELRAYNRPEGGATFEFSLDVAMPARAETAETDSGSAS